MRIAPPSKLYHRLMHKCSVDIQAENHICALCCQNEHQAKKVRMKFVLRTHVGLMFVVYPRLPGTKLAFRSGSVECSIPTFRCISAVYWLIDEGIPKLHAVMNIIELLYIISEYQSILRGYET